MGLLLFIIIMIGCLLFFSSNKSLKYLPGGPGKTAKILVELYIKLKNDPSNSRKRKSTILKEIIKIRIEVNKRIDPNNHICDWDNSDINRLVKTSLEQVVWAIWCKENALKLLRLQMAGKQGTIDNAMNVIFEVCHELVPDDDKGQKKYMSKKYF